MKIDYLKYATTFTLYETGCKEIGARLKHQNYDSVVWSIEIIQCNRLESTVKYKVSINQRLCLTKSGNIVNDSKDFTEKQLANSRFESLEMAFAAAEKIVKKLFNKIKKIEK